MMRQHPKTIGAPLAQTGLLRQQKNRTHGVVAGARNNTPPCVGAVLAQTASRVSRPTRYAPAALCLRRRSQPHRWSPTKRDLRARVANQVFSSSSNSLRTRAHAIWSSSFHPSIDIRVSVAVPCSALASDCDQQSQLLLDLGTNVIVLNHISAFGCSSAQHWEHHGKSDRRRNAGIRSRRTNSGVRPAFSQTEGVGGLFSPAR
jgi:hypothetical protein